MAKVHPNDAVVPEPAGTGRAAVVKVEEQQPTVLTVWRKSLLFNCDGFTVFDANGDLAFRVDCYGSSGGYRRRHAEVVLMDAAGKPILTVRRKVSLSLLLAERWVVYDGDGTGAAAAKPLLSVRRHHAGLIHRASDNNKAVAHLTPFDASVLVESYVVEGSYGKRSCAVRDARGGAAVAEVRRKKSVGDDVFQLVVADPRGLGAPLAMGIVIALDEMFGGATGASSRSLLPRSWSA